MGFSDYNTVCVCVHLNFRTKWLVSMKLGMNILSLEGGTDHVYYSKDSATIASLH